MPKSIQNPTLTPLYAVLRNGEPLFINGITLSHTERMARDVISYLNIVSNDNYTLERVGHTDKPISQSADEHYTIQRDGKPMYAMGSDRVCSYSKRQAQDIIFCLKAVSSDSYTLGLDTSNQTPSTPNVRIHKSELERIGVSAENVFTTSMPDDSMNMAKGDTIYIDTARKTIKDGCIYALEMDGYFYCKRLFKTIDGITLASDADGFEDITLDAQEAMQKGFKIIGWLFKYEHLEQWETVSLLPPERLQEVSA